MMQRIIFTTIALLLLAASACDKPQKTNEVKDGIVVQKEALKSDEAKGENLGESPVLGNNALSDIDWVDANNRFAIESIKLLQDEANLVFSPYSFERALGMTAVGARGETRAQMLAALGFKDDGPNIDEVGGQIENAVLSREAENFVLRIANKIYVEKSFKLLDEYSAVLREHYRSAAKQLDFKNEAEPSRLAINDWVSQNTNQRINDLLPPDSINDLTRLVLVNALYFKAAWQHAFNSDLNKELIFRGINGETKVTGMKTTKSFSAFKAENFSALLLPYAPHGEFAMLIMLPHSDDGVDALTASLSPELIREILHASKEYNVNLTLPKFKQENSVKAKELFRSLGMKRAFTLDADFAGIDKDSSLFVDNIYHKAFIEIDENGTEAAAATAVVMMKRSMIPRPKEELDFTVDHPFLFAIVHLDTQTMLFLGRIKAL
ncbi:MAG: serpin family protein [Bradymonadales bacterium]|jgi:serpin B